MSAPITCPFRYALGARVRLAGDPQRLVWRVCARHSLPRATGLTYQYSVVPVELEADTPAYVADEDALTPVEED